MKNEEDPKSVPRPCLVCGKNCHPSDKNIDGTYAHRECLYNASVPWRPK